ncbi:HIT domain-containing protein [Dokdonella sp. MW10]|uniref:HIT domain-containing protein n=1 Tax=Dokdonella sp. MW10 TaxID=2992926 RepID=UPI003F7F2DAC
MSGVFTLDARLAGDTHAVAELPLSRLLLMDDARFAWLILVPRVADARDLTDLPADVQRRLLDEINHAAAALRAVAPGDKLNVATLGNVVAQLHVHVIQRRIGDAAWPAPVWGHGTREAYTPADAAARVAALRAALGAP